MHGYILNLPADNNAKNPILHEGERDAVKALCRRFNIDVPSSPVLPSRRRKKGRKEQKQHRKEARLKRILQRQYNNQRKN